jgi:hypothetical protein
MSPFMVPDAPLEQPHPRSWRTLELFLPLLLLAWRIAAGEGLRLVTDVVAVLSIYWIYTVFAGNTRAWRIVTGALLVSLLVLYASRQLPSVLTRFDLGPP